MLENTLKSILSQLLKRPFILLAPNVPLGNLGMNDAIAQVLSNRIRDELGLELAAATPSSTSLSDLTGMLLEQLTTSRTV